MLSASPIPPLSPRRFRRLDEIASRSLIYHNKAVAANGGVMDSERAPERFQLAPYNWGLSDETLLDDLRSVARKLGKSYVTKVEYDKLGRLCASTLQNRFGSWCKAHELAGLREIRHFNTTAADCINDLRLVANKLGKTILTTNDYRPHGQYDIGLIARRCGSFRAALDQAGLAPSPKCHQALTDEELFENLEHLWEALGRQPTKNDYFKPLSQYSCTPYVRRFGSYRKALEAFVSSFESESTSQASEGPETSIVRLSEAVLPARHKTSRSISWRMRFLVMRRDHFKCRLCGASPALKPGIVLVVDHIKSWESGGETEMDNLQTLCEPCNGGKSNLPLTEGGS